MNIHKKLIVEKKRIADESYRKILREYKTISSTNMFSIRRIKL